MALSEIQPVPRGTPETNPVEWRQWYEVLRDRINFTQDSVTDADSGTATTGSNALKINEVLAALRNANIINS